MKDDINHIIRHIHRCARNNNVDLVPTDKNKRTIYKYQINSKLFISILSKIDKNNLYKGPVIDRDRNNEYLYIFKYYLNSRSINIYIKIKILQNSIKVISFHEDE